MTELFKARISFICIAIVFGGLISLVFFNSLPYNPLQSKSEFSKIVIKSILPESWGFFTRNPQETKLFVYKKEGDIFTTDTRQKQTSLYNLFGVKRDAKKYSIIIGNIISLIRWDSCYENLNVLLHNFPTQYQSIEVKNYEQEYIPKGDYLIITCKITPWAWRSHEKDIKQLLYYKIINFK